MNMNYLEYINMNWKMLTLYDYVLKELKWIELNMFNCIKHIHLYRTTYELLLLTENHWLLHVCYMLKDKTS